MRQNLKFTSIVHDSQIDNEDCIGAQVKGRFGALQYNVARLVDCHGIRFKKSLFFAFGVLCTHYNTELNKYTFFRVNYVLIPFKTLKMRVKMCRNSVAATQ